ncbi:unnamed protein product [Amoebophrya sp. A120]|nr:unnamed protein product [Amoebophrya sp. A120]|eukprot:GSA120T00013623001.1
MMSFIGSGSLLVPANKTKVVVVKISSFYLVILYHASIFGSLFNYDVEDFQNLARQRNNFDDVLFDAETRTSIGTSISTSTARTHRRTSLEERTSTSASSRSSFFAAAIKLKVNKAHSPDHDGTETQELAHPRKNREVEQDVLLARQRKKYIKLRKSRKKTNKKQSFIASLRTSTRSSRSSSSGSNAKTESINLSDDDQVAASARPSPTATVLQLGRRSKNSNYPANDFNTATRPKLCLEENSAERENPSKGFREHTDENHTKGKGYCQENQARCFGSHCPKNNVKTAWGWKQRCCFDRKCDRKLSPSSDPGLFEKDEGIIPLGTEHPESFAYWVAKFDSESCNDSEEVCVQHPNCRGFWYPATPSEKETQDNLNQWQMPSTWGAIGLQEPTNEAKIEVTESNPALGLDIFLQTEKRGACCGLNDCNPREQHRLQAWRQCGNSKEVCEGMGDGGCKRWWVSFDPDLYIEPAPGPALPEDNTNAPIAGGATTKQPGLNTETSPATGDENSSSADSTNSEETEAGAAAAAGGNSTVAGSTSSTAVANGLLAPPAESSQQVVQESFKIPGTNETQSLEEVQATADESKAEEESSGLFSKVGGIPLWAILVVVVFALVGLAGLAVFLVCCKKKKPAIPDIVIPPPRPSTAPSSSSKDKKEKKDKKEDAGDLHAVGSASSKTEKKEQDHRHFHATGTTRKTTSAPSQETTHNVTNFGGGGRQSARQSQRNRTPTLDDSDDDDGNRKEKKHHHHHKDDGDDDHHSGHHHRDRDDRDRDHRDRDRDNRDKKEKDHHRDHGHDDRHDDRKSHRGGHSDRPSKMPSSDTKSGGPKSDDRDGRKEKKETPSRPSMAWSALRPGAPGSHDRKEKKDKKHKER